MAHQVYEWFCGFCYTPEKMISMRGVSAMVGVFETKVNSRGDNNEYPIQL